MAALTFGSLFTGIGGMDLGLERAGMQCVWQVEIDAYCRRVLAKHWPSVRRHDDVRTFPPNDASEWRCDVIAGGFPCQDISNAGKRAGITGERSGLWSEMLRIIRVVRPRIVIVENVAALLGRGMGRVLGDLAESGFDAEWDRIPTGITHGHLRNRVFIVANSVRQGLEASWQRGAAADQAKRIFIQSAFAGLSGAQPASPVVRNVHGIPRRMDRIGGLGNAVVPQVAEYIGRRIIEAAGE